MPIRIHRAHPSNGGDNDGNHNHNGGGCRHGYRRTACHGYRGFEAAYDTGRPGPTVVFLAEYDALPGIGHGCGHSVYGPNSSLAGAALKQVIDRFGGQVRVDGTPGEEGSEKGSAKGASTRASSTMWTSPCARTRPAAAITCHRATWPANRSISSSRARRHTPRAAPNSASTRSTA